MARRRWQAVMLCLTILVPVTGFAQDEFFDSNGVRIRYTDQGTGEVIVLNGRIHHRAAADHSFRSFCHRNARRSHWQVSMDRRR